MTSRLSLYVWVLFSAVIFLGGCVTSKKATQDQVLKNLTSFNQQGSGDSLEVIRAGDEIEILVWGYDDFNTRTTVSSNGTIAMPLIGEIAIGGMSKDQAKEKLTSQLSEYIKDEIRLTISIINKRDNIITILGSVNSPNNFPVVDEISLFELLSMAGGTTTDADLANVKIYRRSKKPQYQKIDMTRYFNEGQLNPEVKVGPGDIVFIPQEKNLVRELSTFFRDLILVFGLFRATS